MTLAWLLIACAVGLLIWMVGQRRRVRAGGTGIRDDKNQDRFPRADLNANVNPSQLGNEADLWPDRTGARTRRELGARHAADVTFVGDREENKGQGVPVGGSPTGATPARTGATPPRTGAATPETGPVGVPGRQGQQELIRREVAPGPHEHGPGTRSGAGLAPEDEFGEDRPAPRTVAPDRPPDQWHPDDHGVPGDHIRDGHHRSATAPTRKASTTDPYAHAPVPGPNHILPEGGQTEPPGPRP